MNSTCRLPDIYGVWLMIEPISVGIDTVRISAVTPVDVAAFDRVHHTDAYDVEKTWAKLTRNDEYMRCTYYPNNQLLSVESSLPKLLHGDNLALHDIDGAIVQLSERLRVFGVLPDLSSWRVQRVDYAADWIIPKNGFAYVKALSERILTGYDRTAFRSGCAWRNQSRLIRVYNKSLAGGERKRTDVRLRIEVSEQKQGVRYTAARHSVSPTVENLICRQVASSVLNQWLTKLGVGAAGFGQSQSLRAKVYELFPSRVGAVLEHLHLIQNYGADAYRNGMTSKASYHRYRKELNDAGLLSSLGGLLPLTIEKIERGCD
jgi:hypothetical protein